MTRAGEGQLEIMVNNGNLPNTVDMERTGVYKISFIPETEGVQTVHINFNSEALPGTCRQILPNTVDMERTGVYKISFIPETEGEQTVHINFNSERLPGTCRQIIYTGHGKLLYPPQTKFEGYKGITLSVCLFIHLFTSCPAITSYPVVQSG